MRPYEAGEVAPARAEHAERVSVAEDEYVAGDRARFGDGPVDARRDRIDRLTARHRIGEHVPLGHVPTNRRGGAPFVVAVVPLAKFLAHRGRRESGEARGFQRAVHRTREHERERSACEHGCERGGRGPAARGQGQVGVARVTPGPAPLGLAVPDQHHLVGCVPRIRHRPSLEAARARSLGPAQCVATSAKVDASARAIP